MVLSSVAPSQEARRRVPISGREHQQQQDIDEEARKEELRRFVREKWKRIRELESQSSPGQSTEEEESPLKTTAIKQSERKGSRASSVEYDPENPFDDDKKRVQSSETSKVCAPIRKSASGSIDANSASSNSSLRQRSASPIKKVKSRENVKVSQEKQSAKVVVQSIRPVERQVRAGAVTTDVSKKQEAMPRPASTSGKVSQTGPENAPKRKVMVKAVSSERVMTKTSLQESALRANTEEGRRLMPASTSLTEVAAPSKIDKAGSDDVITKKGDDTPTKRRKRRSEVPHYQPSAVVSLSADTSNALAELEASLARLKAHSGKVTSARRKAHSPLTSPSQDEEKKVKDRSRRSLSPAKEMRQMQLELEKTRGQSSPPRISFLQRMEQKRAEAVSSSSPPPSSSPTEGLINITKPSYTSEKEDLKEQSTRNEPKKPKKRYSYTPTQRQPEGVLGSRGDELGDESSCSIVIGDESIDEMVRQRKSSKFLASVRVFVDVRDQDGEDASSGWIEKLKNVGARVYTKIPSSSSKEDAGKTLHSKLTHIVYKNGRPSTLHYIRSMTSNSTGPAPPIVVGVNWILETLQQGVKIDERDFLVEVGKQAIFNKPRTSMTSKRAPQSTPHRSSPQKLAELLAKKKTIQHAPAQPSPLARRCWNMDASTSSSISAATSYNPNDG